LQSLPVPMWCRIYILFTTGGPPGLAIGGMGPVSVAISEKAVWGKGLAPSNGTLSSYIKEFASSVVGQNY